MSTDVNAKLLVQRLNFWLSINCSN